MHTANFTMTATHFYETQLLLLLPLLHEKDQFKDRHFKGRATCICQQRKFLCRQLLLPAL
jgi:hypothetical protein